MNGRAESSTAHARRPRFYEWVGTGDPVRACAEFFFFFFFMNGGPEKSLTRDCWGRLLLLQGPSFFYKEGWRLLFLFFFFLFNEWRAAATAAAGSAAWVVPSSQPARGGKGHLHATAGLGRNRQCDWGGGGERCGLGILGPERGGGGHTSISISLVAAGDGEGEREDPYWEPSPFQDQWRLGTSGAGTFQPLLPKIKKMSLSISKNGRVGVAE